MRKNIGFYIYNINTNAYFVLYKIWNVNKVLSLLACLFLCNILYAQNEELDFPDTPPAVTIEGLLYYLYEDSHTAMVANANSWEGELVIPEQVIYEKQKYTVNKIEWLAFSFCTTLTKVRLPKTVIDIQHYAGYEASKNPFAGCTNLETIEVDEENNSMCSVDGVLFSKDKSRLYCYPAGARMTTYIVPDDVTWIGGTAFAHNNYLRSVAIPNSVTFLGFEAFGSCRNLQSVRLSESLKYIDAYTFEKCESLRILDIPQKVSGFAEGLFRWTHLDTLVVRGFFPENLRYDTFYFVSDSMIICTQPSEIPKFKKVFSGTVLPLESYKDVVTFTTGQQATIILPVEPDASKGKYYRLDRCENMKIIFEEEQHPQARTPYIIVPKEDFVIDVSFLDLDGLHRDSTNIYGVSFIGTYSKDVFGDKETFYYYIPDSTPDCRNDEDGYVHMGSLRAFLQIDWRKNHQKGSEEKLEIVLHDNPNLILSPLTQRLEKRELFYDLQGRRMFNAQSSTPNGLRSGIYIQNNKKYMVK